MGSSRRGGDGGELGWLGWWALGPRGLMVGSSRRGGEGICSRGDRRGRDVVVRDHWLRPRSLRGTGGVAMRSERLSGCLAERRLRNDRREMA